MDEQSLRALEFPLVLDLLADRAACSLGRDQALALRPLADPAAATRLQRETAEAVDLLTRRGNIPLGGIVDIRGLLQRSAIGGVLEATDLLDIAGTVEAGRGLRAFLQKAGVDAIPTIMPYADRIGTFVEIENAIRRAVASNGTLHDNASPELARVRSRKRTTEQRLIERLNGYLSGSMRSMLQDPVIVQRADRSCLAVKAEHRSTFGGIVHDTSSSGATLFIEPAPVVEIGNEVRELEAAERRETARILADLSGRVGHRSAELSATLAVLATLDCIVARARLALAQRAVEPKFNTRGAVRLLSARHPLIPEDRVVAIDAIVGEPSENRILVITGPNTGGKTATLKTIGLLTAMAQAGLHVPASMADMFCFDAIFADIGDEQSLQQSLSTFSGHITTIARFLASLSGAALVLLDELGAGTDPGEGASLAVALLEYLRVRGARVVATSHYGELKAYAFATEGVQNASVEFDERSLRPTYRVIQGVPGSSNAYAIASRLGIPDEVICQAREQLTGSDASVAIMQELESARRAALDDRALAQQRLREAELLRSRAESELARFERTREEVRDQVLSEVRQVVSSARSRASDLLREIRERQEQSAAEEARRSLASVESEAVEQIDAALDLAPEPAPSEWDAEEDRPLKASDRVRVKSLGLVGELLSDPSGSDRVQVRVGNLRLSIEPESLRPLAAAAPQTTVRTRHRPPAAMEPNGGASGADAAAAVSPQITLLGQRAEEALGNLERYLGEASSAGLERVRIVHGKGTGALRKAVQEYLKSSEIVAGYATAEPAEGGSGATIALLDR